MDKKALIADSANESLAKAIRDAKNFHDSQNFELQCSPKNDKKARTAKAKNILELIPHSTNDQLKINAAFEAIVLTENLSRTSEHKRAVDLWLNLVLPNETNKIIKKQANYLFRKNPPSMASSAGAFVLFPPPEPQQPDREIPSQFSLGFNALKAGLA